MKKKLKKCWKSPFFNILNFFDNFQHFFNFFFKIFFSTFFYVFKTARYFWWKVTFLNGFASREEKVTSKKCSIFRIFCMLRFSIWWPNRYGKWLFTKKIKFCLVPGDTTNATKNEKNMLKKKLKKCWKSQKKCWKYAIFNFYSTFFSTYFFQLFFWIFELAL